MGAEKLIKASVCHGVRDLRFEEVSILPPAQGEVQVAILTTGLCGSDLHYYNHWQIADIIPKGPLILGHESAGVVTEVGPGVSTLQVGDKVALEVGVPCGKCARCLEGRYNICSEMRFRSSGRRFPHFHGTLQERINHPAERCYKLPQGVSPEIGAILEPLSVAMHATNRASLKAGINALVIGAGAVGLLSAAMCKVNKVQNIIIADIQEDRVNFALANGFADKGIVVPMKRPETIEDKLAFAKSVAEMVTHTVIDGKEVGEVDVTFECTGVESCVQTAIFSTRPGGKILLVGMGSPIQTLPITAAAAREVDLLGVFRYANTYQAAIDLVSSNNPLLPDLSKLVTQRFAGLENVPNAFAMAGKVKDEAGNLVIKVMIDTGTQS